MDREGVVDTEALCSEGRPRLNYSDEFVPGFKRAIQDFLGDEPLYNTR
jgi:hypothetical protein